MQHVLPILHLGEPQLSVNPFSDIYFGTVGPSKMFLCYGTSITGEAGLLSSDSGTVAWQKRALQRRDGKTTCFMIRDTLSRQWHDLKMAVIGNQVKGYLDGKPEVDYGASRTRFR